MMNQELKPCPFCGSNHILFREQVGAYEIYCPECDASAGIRKTFEDAAEAWNNRPKKSCPVCGYDLNIRNNLPPIETAHLLMRVVMSQLDLCTQDQVQQLLQQFFSFVLSDHPLELDKQDFEIVTRGGIKHKWNPRTQRYE